MSDPLTDDSEWTLRGDVGDLDAIRAQLRNTAPTLNVGEAAARQTGFSVPGKSGPAGHISPARVSSSDEVQHCAAAPTALWRLPRLRARRPRNVLRVPDSLRVVRLVRRRSEMQPRQHEGNRPMKPHLIAVTVYTIGTACMACTMTKRHLNKRGIPFTEVPIDSDDNIIQAINELDLTSAPVVCAATTDGEQMWDGYRPDRIDALTNPKG